MRHDPEHRLQEPPAAQAKAAPALSVIVKTLNEAGKIEACLRSILACTDSASTEVIVADSLSDDETVRIAARFPVRVVQLSRKADRGCGSAAQLGFQYARGARILLLDGDMELDPEFLPAANRALDADPKLAGVGGLIIDRVMTLEFQRRAAWQGKTKNSTAGQRKHLNGGGLFRADAIRQSGYLTDRNLHACEELEMGLRLSAFGWSFLRLDRPAVSHYGHATPPYLLLTRRWRSKYVYGQGELLRAVLGKGHGRAVMAESLLYGAIVVWWTMLAILAAGAVLSPWPLLCTIGFIALASGLLLVQWKRKRRLAMAVYSIALLSFHGAGMVTGFLRHRIDPRTPIDSVVLHDGATFASAD